MASRLLPLLAVGLAAASINACSASTGHEFTGSGGAAASGSTVSGTGGGDIGFGAGHQGGNGSGTGGSAACAAEPHVAMQIPLDMFIMLDQSGSMSDTVGGGGTKWQAVVGALTTFLQQPGLSGINVGIQYFGQPVGGGGAQCLALTCAQDSDCGPAACGPCMLIIPGFGACTGASGGDSCNAADYSTADVEIAALPGVASQIIASLGQHSPTTSTPTSAALQGGIDHCKTWAGSHPGHAVVHVFATDGDPTECDTDQNHINAIAAAGAGAKILTFVIGVGSSLTALNGVAAAGGTGQAFIVDTNANANAQFLAALNAIRGAALGCQYDIPKPTQGMPDYGKVNVQYTPGGGGPAVVFDHYQDKAHCPPSGDGWYYDDNANPTLINLCDATCNKVGADTTGKIDILLGCKTKDPA